MEDHVPGWIVDLAQPDLFHLQRVEIRDQEQDQTIIVSVVNHLNEHSLVVD